MTKRFAEILAPKRCLPSATRSPSRNPLLYLGLSSASDLILIQVGSSDSHTRQNSSTRDQAVDSIMNRDTVAKRARIGLSAAIMSAESLAASSAQTIPSTDKPRDVNSSPGSASTRLPSRVSSAKTLSAFSTAPVFTRAALTRRIASPDCRWLGQATTESEPVWNVATWAKAQAALCVLPAWRPVRAIT